jgi:SAM-dependent methyltransferase
MEIREFSMTRIPGTPDNSAYSAPGSGAAIENLRTIPDPLIAKAKGMGIQPGIHNADFLFEHVLRFCKGDFEGAVHNYYDQGKGSATLVHMWVDDYRKSLEIMRERNGGKEATWSPKKVLDFAAGYGRLSRHLPIRFPNSKVQTCDIHPAAVDFNTNVLGLESYSSAVKPEDLKIPQQDVIICLSFFSHIPKETYFQWLKQLVSHLSPQGILLFTAHGHVSHTSGPVKDIEVDQEGFGFRPKSEQKDLDTAEYGTTISFPSYVFGLMSQCDDVRLVRFQEGLWWRMQDAYMFART